MRTADAATLTRSPHRRRNRYSTAPHPANSAPNDQGGAQARPFAAPTRFPPRGESARNRLRPFAENGLLYANENIILAAARNATADIKGGIMGCSNPWNLYDELIAGVPEGIAVTDYALGLHWSYVAAECGCGVAWTMRGGQMGSRKRPDLRGRDLKSVAALAKSWNFEEATLGVAALNAWYSRKELLDPLGAVYEEPKPLAREERKREAFGEFTPQMKGKKVTVIGHFPHVYEIAERCDELTVLERNCSEGDLPDPACEYVLPQQDVVFITGTTTTNKTLPRLLELSRDALTILTGPSVVAAPALFDHHADVLAGSVVNDFEKLAFAVKNGQGRLFGEALQMMRVVKPGLDLDLQD